MRDSLVLRRFCCCFLLLLVTTLLPHLAGAQTAPLTTKPVPARITARIDATQRAPLAHSIPARVAHATDLGKVAPNLAMKDMMLLLQPSAAQQKQLDAFLGDVQNPSSPNYHKWLTPAQYGAQFGAAQQDIDTLTAWLTSQGFTVEAVAAGHNWIRFSGTAAQVEQTFATEIHNYTEGNAKRVSNATELTIPSALSPVVTGVLSVNNFEKAPLHTEAAQVKRNSAGKLARVSSLTNTAAADTMAVPETLAQPGFTSQGQPEQTLLAPGDFAKIYNTSPLVANGTNGSGVSIAVVGRSDINLSDIESFRTVFSLPFNDPVVTYANTDPGVVAGDDEEATLDTEWSGAVAPQATIQYVIGATTTTTDGVDIASTYIVDHALAPIMTLSFGACEQGLASSELSFYNSLWQQASAEGISVLVSSGDAGASDCISDPAAYRGTSYGFGVSGLASTPYDTAVGGTEFNDVTPGDYWSDTGNADLSSAKGYIPELAWNESCNSYVATSLTNCYFDQTYENVYAGGGGASTCSTHSASASILTGLYTCTSGYAKPSWQSGNGVPDDNERDLPDVALAAAAQHDGFLLCFDGSCQWTTNPDGSVTLEQASIIGGTSAAAPSMAGILALVEQKNGQFQGLVNPQLYALAGQQDASCDSSTETDPTKSDSCVFHDITGGSNSITCTGTSSGCTVAIPGITTFKQLSGWSAGSGYDLATGLGSVNAANLVTAWGKLTQQPSATTLTLSSTTFAHGTPVTVTSTTTPSSGTGTPTGSIVLTAAGSTTATGPIVSETLTGGVYTGSISNLPGGTYTLTSEYGGDVAYASSKSSPVSVTVTPEDSVMTAQTEAYSKFIILGRRSIVAVTSAGLNSTWFIAVNMAGTSGNGIPTGTVTISNGNTSLGTYTLDRNGSIMLVCGPSTPCDLPIGTYNLTVSYSGDSSFNPSTTTLPFSITKGTANWSVYADHQYAVANTQVVATVYFGYDPATLPTGTVTLFRTDTNATLGTASIGPDGTAVIPFLAPAGTYFINASWPGDSNYTAGTWTSYPEIIASTSGAAATTTTLTTTATATALGQRTSVIFKVAPSATTTNIPTGTVTLYSQNGQIANAVPLVGGTAAEFVEWDLAGPQQIYAVYSGDTNFAGSSTATSTVTVAKATPVVAVSALSPYVAVGAQTSVTALLTSPLASTNAVAPSGTIQFFDSVNGGAAQPIGTPQAIGNGNAGALLATLAPMLPTGSNVITATYSGDANWVSATGAVTAPIVVTTPDFSLTPPSGTVSVTAGQAASIALGTQSILGYNTPITISCGTVPAGVTCKGATIAPGSNGTITLSTTAPGMSSHTQATREGNPLLPLSGALSLAGLVMLVLPRRRILRHLAVVLLAMSIATGFSGCGGSSTPQAPAFTITSSSTQVASGTAVTFTASAQTSGSSTGTVTFYADGAAIGNAVPLTNSEATLTTSSLSVGTHAITAQYNGSNASITSSSSDTLEQEVTGSFTLVLTGTAGQSTHSISVPVTLD